MKSSKNSNTINKRSKNFGVKIIFFIISLYCVCNIIITQVNITKQMEKLESIKEKYQSQLRYNDEYKNIILLEADEDYINRVAKEKLDFVSQDDRVFIDISSK